jgi:hypothetical protein
LGELVANSPKITPTVWLLFELFRLKRGELKKIVHGFKHPISFCRDTYH